MYWIRFCPECKLEGQLVVVKDMKDNKLFVVCDECDIAWDTPEDADLEGRGFEISPDQTVQNATAEDIKHGGWDRYEILDEKSVPRGFDPGSA